jgi:hypothetical protein
VNESISMLRTAESSSTTSIASGLLVTCAP